MSVSVVTSIFSELNNAFTTDKSDDCRLVLLEGLNDDRHVLNALLQRAVTALDQQTKDDSRIYLAYRYFVTRLATDLPDDKDIPAFVLNVLQGVDLLILTGRSHRRYSSHFRDSQ